MHNAYGYGLFTGGLGLHYGAERMGAMVVPASGGNTPRQVLLIADLSARILCCTPSYALHIADTIAEAGIDPREHALAYGLFGAEPWSIAMRDEIERRLGLRALDIYGLSEMVGPGVASECTEQAGAHVCEDHFVVEVIDPATGALLPDGVEGELVFTSLTREAMPLLRYRTGDLASLSRAPVRAAAGRSRASAASRAAPTTCSSCAASTSSPPRSRRRCSRCRASHRTTSCVCSGRERSTC